MAASLPPCVAWLTALRPDTRPFPSTSSSWSGQFFPGTQPVYPTPWPKLPLEPRESPHSRGLAPNVHNQALFPESPDTGKGDQERGGRPGSLWPVGRVEAGPRATLPCGICSLPVTAGETNTHTGVTAPAYQALCGSLGTPEPMSLAGSSHQTLCP